MQHGSFGLFRLLRTVALIVSAHSYCARKFICHDMHRARALSTKMNNDRADGHCSVIGFNDLGRSATPSFPFRNRFYLQLSPHCSKMNKKSTGHGILPSCGCKARENANLFFEEPHQLTKFA